MPNHPSYSQICKRVNKLLDIATKRSGDDDEDGIVIALDNTGKIKVTNRGQWMQQEKWHIKKEKKGNLKILVAVNIKTNKEILVLEIIDEKVHDGKIMDKLVSRF